LTAQNGAAGVARAPRADVLAARRFAVAVIDDVLRRRLPLDDLLDRLGADPVFAALSPSDRGLTRAIAGGALRRLGTIRGALAERLERGFPPRAGRLEPILIAGAAQILELGTPVHAAVDTTVSLAREDAHARHFADLANAVMRRIAAEREAILAASDALAVDTPGWLADRWTRAYGAADARRIADAHRREPAVDITVRSEPEAWAERLGAELLPTGSLRLSVRTAIRQLPGYDEGAWWVQDAAAALPARLLGDIAGKRVLDVCAAPGGKTAQLAAAGARVTALDRSEPRMRRLSENMERLGLAVEVVVADALAHTAAPYDAVLVDAPCSATGTIRRHPDVAWSRTMEDVAKLTALQAKLLDHAAGLVAAGGTLVYATCSLERDEGEAQVAAFLARQPRFRLAPVRPEETGGVAEVVSPEGYLRCLPFHMPHAVERMAGMDGFFAARLVRTVD
jgi:16S rRNA (cytosine967-C5)-methyltransferase